MVRFNRRQFCAIAGTTALPQPVRRLPNIVYILADDLGWGDLECYNPRSAIPTPRANRLASEGVRFTDMHSPSSVCTPTRYGILTGRYCWRSRLTSGVLDGYSRNLIEPGRLTLPSMLKARGYYTAGIGKWHLGLGDLEPADFSRPLRPGPVQHGFDYYFGIPASLDMPPYLYFENERVVEAPLATTEGRNSPRGVFGRQGRIAPGFKIDDVLPALGQKAVDIVRERAGRPERPFFLYLALTAPHTPWVPKAEYRGRSGAGLYGDFVAQVDDTLGSVLDAIDEARCRNDTLVVFTSDNGADWKPEDKLLYPHLANARRRGEKADIWDGGHRIPFIVRWPGNTPAGSSTSELGCLTDFMATAAAITGAELPDDAAEDSFDLLTAYRGRAAKPVREAIVHHSIDGMFSIRQGDWKLELGLGSGGFSSPRTVEPAPDGVRGQLYNIAEDPEEIDNQYARRPDVIRRLTALLDRYRSEGRSRPKGRMS
jgi:arylsulfatase A